MSKIILQINDYLVLSLGEEIERKFFNIENCLQKMGKSTLTAEHFESIKASLLQDLEKPQNNLQAMGDLLQKLAFKYKSHLDWVDKNSRFKRVDL